MNTLSRFKFIQTYEPKVFYDETRKSLESLKIVYEILIDKSIQYKDNSKLLDDPAAFTKSAIDVARWYSLNYKEPELNYMIKTINSLEIELDKILEMENTIDGEYRLTILSDNIQNLKRTMELFCKEIFVDCSEYFEQVKQLVNKKEFIDQSVQKNLEEAKICPTCNEQYEFQNDTKMCNKCNNVIYIEYGTVDANNNHSENGKFSNVIISTQSQKNVNAYSILDQLSGNIVFPGSTSTKNKNTSEMKLAAFNRHIDELIIPRFMSWYKQEFGNKTMQVDSFQDWLKANSSNLQASLESSSGFTIANYCSYYVYMYYRILSSEYIEPSKRINSKMISSIASQMQLVTEIYQRIFETFDDYVAMVSKENKKKSMKHQFFIKKCLEYVATDPTLSADQKNSFKIVSSLLSSKPSTSDSFNEQIWSRIIMAERILPKYNFGL